MAGDDARAARWHRFGSVRVRTTTAATLIVGLALTFGAIELVSMLHRSELANIETAARLRARDVGALVRNGTLPATLPGSGSDTALVQVVDGNGRVVAATGNVAGEPPIAHFVPPAHGSAAGTVRAPIGEAGTFRVVAVVVDRPQGGALVVYAGTSLEAAAETQHTLVGALAFGTPLLVVLVAAMTWLLTGAALRPVERIRTEVNEITAHALGRRVPEPNGGDEIARLARTMNEMLDRIEAGTERQRRFVADASHELRSPLSSLRAQLEVARAHPQRADWLATTDDSLAEVDRMERLTRDLLMLTRLDADPQRIAEPVDVAQLVRDEAVALASREVVAVDVGGLPERANVIGDSEQLARLFRNVLDNAERHASRTVTIGATVDGNATEITVADDGTGIAVADRDRVFERFTRLDEARDRDSGGAGLGLAIAREIAVAHGGTVTVVDVGRGACIAVRLPNASHA
jgi:signal transduction histidine kinase